MGCFGGYQSSFAIIASDSENSQLLVKTNLTIQKNGRVYANLWHFEPRIIPALESFWDMFWMMEKLRFVTRFENLNHSTGLQDSKHPIRIWWDSGMNFQPIVFDHGFYLQTNLRLFSQCWPPLLATNIIHNNPLFGRNASSLCILVDKVQQPHGIPN